MAALADIAKDSGRNFTRSHPWITFRADLGEMPWRFWALIGEARSKCRHLAWTPLPPPLADRLRALYLAKGAHATTAIEGNTLTEDQALEAVMGELHVPPSQEYLKREVENIIKACAEIERETYADGAAFDVSPSILSQLNQKVLNGLESDDHVVPGELRDTSVVVGNVYLGAPAADCEFLLDLLCRWLDGDDFAPTEDPRECFLRVVLRAVIAHIYIAWIHPFGDGNGRTARLVEFGIFTSAGVPSVAAHLLSNHYNATRAEYYRQLDYASKSGGDLRRFLMYAVEGFVDQLQQQLDSVHMSNLETAWHEYVHELFAGETTPAPRRQLALMLELGPDWTARSAISTLTPDLAAAYAGKGAKTVTRDINALVSRGLLERGRQGIRARREIMLQFLPPVAEGSPV